MSPPKREGGEDGEGAEAAGRMQAGVSSPPGWQPPLPYRKVLPQLMLLASIRASTTSPSMPIASRASFTARPPWGNTACRQKIRVKKRGARSVAHTSIHPQ